MKRFAFAVCGVLLLGAIPLLAGEKVPVIAFDSLNKDFGKVPEGQMLKHIFKFTNKGSALLENIKAEGS